MLWEIVGSSRVLSGLLLGGRFRLPRSASADETPVEAPPVRPTLDFKQGMASARGLLALARDALIHGDFDRARDHAENAVALLDAIGAPQAELRYARRVLQDALWPGLGSSTTGLRPWAGAQAV